MSEPRTLIKEKLLSWFSETTVAIPKIYMAFWDGRMLPLLKSEVVERTLAREPERPDFECIY